MSRRLFAALAAFTTALTIASSHAGAPAAPEIERSTEPVVLTGAQFPAWSAGPDPTLREPQPPVNYETANIQPFLGPAQSECYVPPSNTPSAPHANPYDYSDNGDHNCYQSSRLPRSPLEGADVSRLLGYRWNGTGFEQIPFQVDEKFTRFITNNYSGFAFYSGVDKENSYAFDREPFRYTWDAWLESGGNPCLSRPKPGSWIDPGTGLATTPDPVKGLDDDDELVFMYDDAGGPAPDGQPKPAGIEQMFAVRVADPSDPGAIKYAYVALAAEDGPAPAFDASNGYVRYVRDANAGRFAYSQSSYDGYGAAPKGPYCDENGNVVTTPRRAGDQPVRGMTRSSDPLFIPPHPQSWAIEQRRPLDGAWVKTDRYAFRYDGRWLMTQLRVSPDGTGLSSGNYADDIVDQWKARAFQQRPGGETPCCGYEEEVNNWGGSSILFGERAGPVRVIRSAWGADSSTNNIKTEVFYRDEIRFQDNLRVHVIPPLDGIYVQWDYNAGKVSTYYNPWRPEGVAIDGKNDEEVFGNTYLHASNGRVEFRDDDEVPVTGPIRAGHHTGLDDPERCKLGQDDLFGQRDADASTDMCNDIDLADPTFSGPASNLNWEQVSGPNGSVVTRWTIRKHTAGDAYSVIAQPYYRDDSCFDDGTGTDPGPHMNSRNVDSGAFGTYTDPGSGAVVPRVCWTPADGDPSDLSRGDGRPRKFWQGSIATHGLHLQFIADSDNAQAAEELTEIDSEQRMVVLPGLQPNVGERYGRSADVPLVAAVTPYAY